jgi:hypothetical protein
MGRVSRCQRVHRTRHSCAVPPASLVQSASPTVCERLHGPLTAVHCHHQPHPPLPWRLYHSQGLPCSAVQRRCSACYRQCTATTELQTQPGRGAKNPLTHLVTRQEATFRPEAALLGSSNLQTLNTDSPHVHVTNVLEVQPSKADQQDQVCAPTCTCTHCV